MRKFLVFATVVVSSIFFLACGEEAIPVPLPPPPPSTMQPAPEAELPPPAEPVASAPASPPPVPAAAPPVPAAAPPPPPPLPPPPPSQPPPPSPPPPPPVRPLAIALSEDTDQLKYGRYTIQIGVSTNESFAKSLVKKMADNGIKAYYVKVNNPDNLYGLYHRVRIGYFSAKSAAEGFARNRLEPLGYAWWVDYSRNDAVGNSDAVATAVPSKPVAAAPPPPADPKLEEAKREYKRIAEEATKAKQAAAAAPPPKPSNPDLEEAKREYKRIAEEATKAKKLQQKK